MSGTQHDMKWTISIADFFEMDERQLGHAGLPDDIPQAGAEVWAVGQLEQAMDAAGRRFIEENPGLFIGGLT